jgi:hypothetical protein
MIITENVITYLYYHSAHKSRALSEMPLQNVARNDANPYSVKILGPSDFLKK